MRPSDMSPASMPRRYYAAVLAVLAAVLLAGCGGSSLTSEETSDVADAQVTLSAVVLDALDVGRCAGPNTGSACDTTGATDAIARLVAIYRAKPDAKYDPGGDGGDDLTMRQVLEDQASDLDEHEPDLAAKLDRALSD